MSNPRPDHNRTYIGIGNKVSIFNDEAISNTINNIEGFINNINYRCTNEPCKSCSPCQDASCSSSSQCPEGCTCCNGQCKPSVCQDIPEQITLSLAGMGGLFLWSSRNSGVPGMQLCNIVPGPPGEGLISADPYEPFCGQCDTTYDITIRGGGTSAGIAGYSGDLVIQDFSVILDRDTTSNCYWSWSGYAPVPPAESAFSGGGTNVSCNGELGIPVSVSISPVELATTVSISSPTMSESGETATAEVSNIGDNGSVSSVSLPSPGSGYAREIFARSAPSITAGISGNGNGAVINATVSQVGTGESAYWYVSAINLVNGGTGYSGTNTVVSLTPQTGTTVDLPAIAIARVGRTVPTVTASVAGGSGAVLSVSLQEVSDWFENQSYWEVISVDVVQGGEGYTDGDSVVFSVDGESYFGAEATVNAPNGIIESINMGWGGGYWKSTGVIESVTLWEGGQYYVSTPTGQSQVDNPKVLFSSYSGTTVEATANVDGVVGSPTFGQITGINVMNGGQNHRLSGIGWLITINVSSVGHLEFLRGNETAPIANTENSNDCANFWNNNESIENRVSFQPCPSDLISKSYKMSCGSFFGPFGGPEGAGLANSTWCQTQNVLYPWTYFYTFINFGKGDITCTISPA